MAGGSKSLAYSAEEPPPVMIRRPEALPSNLALGLYCIHSPSDGGCYLHSILNGYYLNYRLKLRENGERASCAEIVCTFRLDLADYLAAREGAGRATIYSGMMGGCCAKFYEEGGHADYSLAGMQTNLRDFRPQNLIGTEFHQLISDVAGKDVYIVLLRGGAGEEKRLQVSAPVNKELLSLLYLGRPSVIIILRGGHYDLLARKRKDGRYQTLFRPEDPLVVKLLEGLMAS